MIINLTTDGVGTFELPVVVPDDEAYCGMDVYAQAMQFNDPAAPGDKQSAQTNYVQRTLAAR